MAEYPAWGLHITDVSVIGVKLDDAGGSVQVVAYDQIDFTEDVDDLASLQRTGALLHAMAMFLQRHDLKNCRIWVSVDGATAFNRFVETPVIQGETLAKILDYEAQQQIPFPLDEVYWDHKVLSNPEARNQVEVMIFAIKKAIVEERRRRLDKMNFAYDGFQLTPVALYNVAAHEGLVANGMVLVGVDYDRVNVVFCHDGKFWFRVIPEGVHLYVEGLRDALDVKHRQAVKILKGEVECPDPAAQKKAARDAADRISGEVARLVKYFGGARQDVPLKGIVLLPGSQLAPPLAADLKQKTGLDVYGLKRFRNLVVDEAIITPEIESSVATLAVPAGLALQGIGRSDVATCLFDPAVERVIAGRRVYYVLAMMVLFAVVAAMWVITWRAGSRVRGEQDALETATQKVEQARNEFASERNEPRIFAAMKSFYDAGAPRLAAVHAAEAVIDAVLAASSGRGDDDVLHLVSLETAAGLADGRGEARTVTATVGASKTGTAEEAAARIQSGFIGRLSGDPRVRSLTSDAPYSAPTLSLVPADAAADRLLRREFVMQRISFIFDAAQD